MSQALRCHVTLLICSNSSPASTASCSGTLSFHLPPSLCPFLALHNVSLCGGHACCVCHMAAFLKFAIIIYIGIFLHVRVSLVAQPAMRETWVQSLGWEVPLEKGESTHSSATNTVLFFLPSLNFFTFFPPPSFLVLKAGCVWTCHEGRASSIAQGPRRGRAAETWKKAAVGEAGHVDRSSDLLSGAAAAPGR